jgi:hypothetical protein
MEEFGVPAEVAAKVRNALGSGPRSRLRGCTCRGRLFDRARGAGRAGEGRKEEPPWGHATERRNDEEHRWADRDWDLLVYEEIKPTMVEELDPGEFSLGSTACSNFSHSHVCESACAHFSHALLLELLSFLT